MVDFAGGHPSTEQAAAVIEALDAELGRGAGGEIELHPGVQYRHILVAPADWADADCTPPHDLSDKPAVWPTGPAAAKLRAVMDASRDIVPRLRAGRQPGLALGPGLPAADAELQRRGPAARPALVTAVDLIRGLGVLTDIDVESRSRAPPAGSTPNYEGKRDAALRRAGGRAPTCSSSTSRPPTRPATPATSRRR